MKRFFIRPALAAAVVTCLFGTFACKDYLDALPASTYTNEATFSSISNVNSVVIGIYDPLSGDSGYGVAFAGFGYDTDEAQNRPGAPDGGGRDVNRYRMTRGTTGIVDQYNTMYQGIERASICIDQIPKMALFTNGTPQEKQTLRRLLGEALCVRSMYFLDLARHWGDVPARFEPTPTSGDVTLLNTDRNVIYDHLLADLDLASRYLPWRTQAD